MEGDAKIWAKERGITTRQLWIEHALELLLNELVIPMNAWAFANDLNDQFNRWGELSERQYERLLFTYEFQMVAHHCRQEGITDIWGEFGKLNYKENKEGP